MTPAIEARNVTKMYRVYPAPKDRLKEILLLNRRRFHQEFWALEGVSFDVRRGEVFGIVGPNGSGKSTLLEIVTGTLEPTGGQVVTQGRIATLLSERNISVARRTIAKYRESMSMPPSSQRKRLL